MKEKEHIFIITKFYKNKIEEIERKETYTELKERINFYKKDTDIEEIRIDEKIIIEKYVPINIKNI